MQGFVCIGIMTGLRMYAISVRCSRLEPLDMTRSTIDTFLSVARPRLHLFAETNSNLMGGNVLWKEARLPRKLSMKRSIGIPETPGLLTVMFEDAILAHIRHLDERRPQSRVNMGFNSGLRAQNHV